MPVERGGGGTERERETGKRQKKGAPSLFSVILLQVVMLSPGTHLVTNNESHSRTTESQFKNTSTRGLYVTTQLIQRQTPKLCITVY